MKTDYTPLLKVKRYFKNKVGLVGMRLKTWLKFENLWRDFPTDSVQSKNAMGPPSKCLLDNTFLHFLIHCFVSFYVINNLQFLISSKMFYFLDFPLNFFQEILLTSVSFFINMLKLRVVKLIFILDFFVNK